MSVTLFNKYFLSNILISSRNRMGILKSTKTAWEDKDHAMRPAAVKQLGEAEQDVIAAIAGNDSDEEVRLAAREKLLTATSGTPSDEKDLHRIELQKLLEEADFVASHTPLDFDGNPFEELQNRWEEIAPDDQYELRSSFDSIKNKFSLLAEHFREQQDKNLPKRQQICERLEQINSEDHNRKKVQLVKKLKTAWQSLPPLPQTLAEEVDDRYRNAIREFDEQQQKHQIEEEWRQWANKNKKEELCRNAEELDNESDLETIEKRVKELQKQWRASGAVYGRVSQSLWKRFQHACNRNYQRCQPFIKEKKQKQRQMLNRKEEICREAEQLADSTAWQKTASILQALQTEWKSLDAGPGRGREKRLYHGFRKSCNHFFARRSAYFKEHDHERRQNLSTKEDLCILAETLADEPRLQHGRKFRELQDQWKKTGAAPRNQEEKIWKRFRAACDRYFDWLETQRQENAAAKQALCREALEICNNLDSAEKLGETDEALEKIKSGWQQIGPVYKEQEQCLQNEFQRALDIFYAFRQECYAARDRQRLENLARKEALVERAEQIAGEPSSPEAAAELKELQKQWQTIETAPREHEKILFQNFQAACNAYFGGKRHEVEKNQRQRLDNQKKKERLLLELENIVGISHSNEEGMEKNSTLTLADELKIALESNIFMAGKRDDRQRQREEVEHIQQTWKTIGPTSGNQEQKLWKRYKAALDFFYADHARKKPPRRRT